MYIKETALWCAALVFEAWRPASEECCTISPCCTGGYCRVSWSDGGKGGWGAPLPSHIWPMTCATVRQMNLNWNRWEVKMAAARANWTCYCCFVEGHLKQYCLIRYLYDVWQNEKCVDRVTGQVRYALGVFSYLRCINNMNHSTFF